MTHALIVDDSQQIIEDLRDRLDSLGHSYDNAMSQLEALDLFSRNTYSYILLDLEIPFIYGKPSRIQNGKNTLESIRKSERGSSIPVIVITSHGLDSHKLVTEVMRCGGADDFMGKPFPNIGETLEQKIMDVLKQYPGKEEVVPLSEKVETEAVNGVKLLLEARDGKEYWILNSSPPKLLYKASAGKRAKVMRVIYDFQHLDLIPHDYFLSQCGWKDHEYFLKDEQGNYNAMRGPMKNHLSEINKALGADWKIERGGIRIR
ncbi:MAG: hypothetical protein A2020_11900 [Lentisphaerae bacterium GWF2_45_14]|nr:MAG: hypothetical protein A2020_11900 [Lentisphaerae bacterium GWF2_45_14]